MPLKTRPQSVITTVDPLSLHYGINAVSGNTVQTYNNESKEYEPDRTLVPLILSPYVEVYDPAKVQNGKQALTAVEWYDGVPAKDYSNRITAGEDYEIGDGTVTGFPANALKVKKNVPADSPIQIYCIVKFTDKRTQQTVRVEMNVKLYTTVYESRNYKVTLDCPPSWKIDPLKETDWQHTLTAQLYSGSTAVDDAHAAYWWQVRDENGAWREITSEDEELWLTCKSNGIFTKTLTFDARMMKASAFRVRAAYFDSKRPVTPDDDAIVAETFINMEMPSSLSVEQMQTKGARQAYDFSTKVGFKTELFDNRATVTDTQANELFQIRWKGRSAKAGSSETFIDSGKNIEFVPKDKGFDPSALVSVWADISVYEKHAVLTDDAGKFITDDNGAIIIIPTYE